MHLPGILREQRAVLFLGAGASTGCGLPLGDPAASSIIRALFERIAPPDLWHELAIPERRWPRFEVTLDHVTQFLPDAPLAVLETFAAIGMTATHRILSASAMQPQIWLTTNFDDLIERSLEETGIEYDVLSSRTSIAALHQLPSDRHLVVKLHGDSRSLDPERDLGARIGQILRMFPGPAHENLARLCANRHLVVVGYAARDPDLLPLLGDLIATAASVWWIGKGAPPSQVIALLAQRPDAQYFSAGAPEDLGSNGLPSAFPTDCEATTWEERLASWAATCDADRIRQALATLCLERDDEAARSAVERLHKTIVTRDPRHRLWILEREFELLIRARHPDPTAARLFVRRFLELAGEDDVTQDLRFEAFLNAARCSWRTNSSADAYAHAVKAVHVADALDCVRSRAEALQTLGLINTYRGAEHYEEGLSSLRRAHRLALDADEPLLATEVAQRLSIAMMRNDDPLGAKAILTNALQTAQEIGQPRRILSIMVNLAEALRIARIFDQAIDVNEQVLTRANVLQDDEFAMNAGSNQGLCYVAIGRVAEADQSFIESFERAERRGGGEARANAIYNRGWLRVVLGQWHLALPFILSGASAYAEYGSPERAGGAIGLAAFCRARLGDTSGARVLIERAKLGGLVPQGLFGAEYRLGQFSVSLSVQPPASWLDAILDNFAGDVEQRFYLLTWLLESHDRLQLGARTEALEHAIRAATDSGLAPYTAVLRNVIARWGSSDDVDLIAHLPTADSLTVLVNRLNEVIRPPEQRADSVTALL